jgi:propionyl-CoA synthetase
MPGYDLQVLNSEGDEVRRGETGTLAIRLPLPPSCLPTLWNNDARFRSSYLSEFKGYYTTSDAGYIDQDGYVFVMARTDDVINVAGHRLSTGQMEEVLAGHPDVAECAVIGVTDALKGQSPLGFLCLNRGSTRPHAEVIAECVARVRESIGPVADFKRAVVVERLPKTRSGKILRSTMAKIADSQPFKAPATIDDPAILDEIAVALRTIGLARG